VSWERARVSTAVRVRKPRDKRLVFICLGWLGALPADDTIDQIWIVSVLESLCVISSESVI
jgi:hypothetical protein